MGHHGCVYILKWGMSKEKGIRKGGKREKGDVREERRRMGFV